jgi:hypothetical protein
VPVIALDEKLLPGEVGWRLHVGEKVGVLGFIVSVVLHGVLLGFGGVEAGQISQCVETP